MNTFLQCCEGAVNILKCSCDIPAAKNSQDVAQNTTIAFYICAAIVIATSIAACAILLWKYLEILAAKNERQAKEKESDIADRKKKSDTLNKLIDYLEKNTTIERYDEESGKMMKSEKGLGSNEGQYYIKVLKSVIENSAIPQYPLKEQK